MCPAILVLALHNERDRCDQLLTDVLTTPLGDSQEAHDLLLALHDVSADLARAVVLARAIRSGRTHPFKTEQARVEETL